MTLSNTEAADLRRSQETGVSSQPGASRARPAAWDPAAEHRGCAESFEARARDLERAGQRYGIVRLLTFGVGALLLIAGFGPRSLLFLGGGCVALAFFVAAVIQHMRVLARLDAAEIRAAIHRRHLARIEGRLADLPITGEDVAPTAHPYAGDLDLFGRGSLFQRVDTTQTREGERTLADWLCSPADPDTIAARQEAVADLAARVEWRQELEASALGVHGAEKLDAGPFMAFVLRPSYFRRYPWMRWVARTMPLVLLALFVGARAGWWPEPVWLVWLVVQGVVAVLTMRVARDAFDLVTARRAYVESFARTFAVAERTRFDAPLLQNLQARLDIRGRHPSAFLHRLDRWASLAEQGSQFPLNIFANLFLLWDVNILERLERWNEDVGQELGKVFSALGDLEALAALGAFHFTETHASLPEIAPPGAAFEAVDLSHPLLPAGRRVANDVALGGEGCALVVTGSNMAGKSTLLRAVGLNTVLALAGGPVVARHLRLPPVRVRASMRVDDSLQEGASYFHAELQRLKSVIDAADEAPPVFFLLDELLRGTNARARHLGGRFVVLHLLDRRAMGLVATHDVALSELASERPGKVHNVHFTDVMQDGEMLFDYRLREGVVQTSNALRLLHMAGIEVPQDLLDGALVPA